MYEIDKMPNAIDIGFTGEKMFREVRIDMTKWMEQMPGGVPSIVHIRPGETKADAYIAATTFADNILVWPVTNADLGDREGTGLMQIWLEKEENNTIAKRGKSILVVTRINGAIDDASEEIPEPQESWMEQMTALKTATVTAAEAAEDAQTAAEAAQAAAETAQGLAEDAQAAAETAQGKAEDAQDAAEAAQTAAETAQAAAESAETAAVGAKEYVDAARNEAVSAAGAAQNSATAAETARVKAETAQEKAETAQGKAEDAQEAAEDAQAAAEDARDKYPYISDTTGTWMVWDAEEGEYVDTGYLARPDAVRVQDTQPTDPDGMIWFPETRPDTVQVPTVEEMNTALSGKTDKVTNATTGNFAGLDANGNLVDSGKKPSDFAKPEDIPDPEDIIDDTAGEGDTDKVWSADKSADTVSTLNNDLSSTDDNLESLAENGYYTEGTTPQDVYLQLTSGYVASNGTEYTDNQKGYIWLTSEQEALSLKIDTSVYVYNLCYMNGTTNTKYTGWLNTSPIVLDDTAHTRIAITVKKSDSSIISSLLGQILYYTTGGQINIGNLATKTYVDGMIDNSLSVTGKAADAKTTGDTITVLAENGYIIKGSTQSYYQLTSGFVNNNASLPIIDNIQTNTSNGYISIPKNHIPDGIYYDNTKYKVNTFFGKNGYLVANTWTSWQTTSPVQFTAPSDYDSLWLNVRKLSGTFTADELKEALYKYVSLTVGNLATKSYVDAFEPKGIKQIYPDGFTSRIKPDIYFNGRFVADIDINNYKISGTGEVWVATNGNDTTGDGTENNPYATITKAFTANAVNIHIKEGTYTQGTHYGTGANFGGKNVYGHGSVVLQNDADGHYPYSSGDVYMENITVKHGNATTQQAFHATCSDSGQTACFVNCTFRDGGTNGLAVTGIDAVVIGCVSYGNKYDGFNYHNKTISSTVYNPNVLEIDCVGYNNGSDQSGMDSCNGSTAHDGARIIRLNGEYYSCYGGVIAEIGLADGDPTISVNYGVVAHDSTGTGTYKASFWASVNTKMYLYDCKSYGGTYDISAINDALVVSRRLTTGRDVPAVNVANTASVLQY